MEIYILIHKILHIILCNQYIGANIYRNKSVIQYQEIYWIYMYFISFPNFHLKRKYWGNIYIFFKVSPMLQTTKDIGFAAKTGNSSMARLPGLLH